MVLAKVLFEIALILSFTTLSFQTNASKAPPDSGFFLETWKERLENDRKRPSEFKFEAYAQATNKSLNANRSPSSNSTIQFDGQFGLKSVEIFGPDEIYKAIVNEDYFAFIQLVDGNWCIVELFLASDKQFQTESDSIFASHGLGSIFQFASIDELASCEKTTVELISNPSDSSKKYKIEFSGVSERLKCLVFESSETNQWLPDSVYFDYGSTARSKQFTDWKTVNGLRVWTKELSSIPKEFDPQETFVEFHTKYEIDARSLNKQECYLSYYDLPEPRGASRKRLSRFWIVAVLLLVSALALFLKSKYA